MFKKISLFLVLVLVIGALSACADSGLGTSKLSDQKKQEIETAWYNQGSLPLWQKEGQSGGNRYYGNYEGYDVFMFDGYLTALSAIQIGEYVFKHGNSFKLCAYCDGEMFHLKALYEEGKISDKSIAVLADYHNKIGKTLPVSDEMSQNVKLASFKSSRPINWNAKDGEPGAIRYYGNFEGYDVILLFPKTITHTGEHTKLRDGHITFLLPCEDVALTAYKDGSFTGVWTLYQDNIFSLEVMTKILEEHNKYDNTYGSE